MTTLLRSLALGLALLAAGPAAAQDLLHYWNFNAPTGTSGEQWPAVVPATTGSGELEHAFEPGTLQAFNGTATNAQGGDSAGASFSVQNGSSAVNNGRAFVLRVPTTGYGAVRLAYATQRTSTGFTSHAVAYSLDGVTFTEHATISDLPSSFGLREVDFSAVPGAADNADFAVRITVDGGSASSASGNNRFDNLTVTGLPSGTNRAPAFTSELASQTIPAEEPFSFTYEATDDDGDPLTFALVDGPAGATLDPFSGHFEWTPAAADAGLDFVVRVAVSDGEASDETTATLSVEGGGEPGVAHDLFFSEYVEGSSFNKAVELYNGTGQAVDLSGYRLELYTNGSPSVSQSTTLSGTLAHGDVFVAAHPSADPAILAVADLTNGAVINFNGDDAVVLRTTAGAVVDVIGRVGEDPGAEWGSGDASTADNTLRRKVTSCAGDTNPFDPFDPAELYDGYPNNTFDGLGAHAASCTAPPDNDAPFFTATLAGELVDAGASVAYTYVAEDPDGDPVTYALASGPDGAVIDAVTGELTWTATAPGVFALVVTASDGTASTSTRTVVGVRGELCPGDEGAALRECLRAAYTPALTMGYDVARDTMYARIDRQADGRVEGVYTGFSVVLPDGVDPSAYLAANGINAEHTWPQSFGAGAEPARSDMHNLFPTKDNVNSARSNKPYAEVPDEQTVTWYRLSEATSTIPPPDVIDEYAENAPGFFEPREAHKGNAARAALYFFTVYEAVADRSFLLEQKETFVAWDAYDPADVAEVVRTEGIARRQGTINPFVIDPSLAGRAVTDIVPPEPITIAEARAEADGTVVTVEGIVTRAGGRFTRIQDASGDGATGLTTFQSSGALRAAVEAGDVARGDSLRVTGTMATFNGLRQMSPTRFEVLARGVDLPEAQAVTLAELAANGEAYESELVRVEGLRVDTGDEAFAAARTYAVSDGTVGFGAVDLRTPSSGEGTVIGTGVPGGLFAFEGVLGEFAGTYQLSPIDATDIEPDVTAPVIEVVEGPLVLWPPNGQYQRVALADLVVSVSDAEQGAIDPSLVRIVRVTSDEAENGENDGNTTDDIVIGAACTSADLRAERQETGDGRVYTLHLAVGDGSGNVGEATAEVHVPVGRNDAVVGGPVVYEVAGTCDVEYAPLAPVGALAVGEGDAARGEGGEAGKDGGAETAETQSAAGGEAGVPAEFALAPAYPNPFASRATVGYALPEPAEVRVVVYDVLGRQVAVLADGPFEAGRHAATFDASVLPSGTYLVRMTTDGGFADTQRITVLR